MKGCKMPTLAEVTRMKRKTYWLSGYVQKESYEKDTTVLELIWEVFIVFFRIDFKILENTASLDGGRQEHKKKENHQGDHCGLRFSFAMR